MTRWSLGNTFRRLSYQQFFSLSAQFKQAAEESFGTECRLDIRVMSGTKVYTTFKDDFIQEELDRENKEKTFFETQHLSKVTKDMWDRAGYVEVILKPADEKAGPRHAFGHVEFKGMRWKEATFYIQPGGEGIKAAMIQNNARMWVGDGFESNGVRSGAIPLGMGLPPF